MPPVGAVLPVASVQQVRSCCRPAALIAATHRVYRVALRTAATVREPFVSIERAAQHHARATLQSPDEITICASPPSAGFYGRLRWAPSSAGSRRTGRQMWFVRTLTGRRRRQTDAQGAKALQSDPAAIWSEVLLRTGQFAGASQGAPRFHGAVMAGDVQPYAVHLGDTATIASLRPPKATPRRSTAGSTHRPRLGKQMHLVCYPPRRLALLASTAQWATTRSRYALFHHRSCLGSNVSQHRLDRRPLRCPN